MAARLFGSLIFFSLDSSASRAVSFPRAAWLFGSQLSLLGSSASRGVSLPGVTRLFVSPLALLDSGAFRAASFPRAALLFGCQLSRLDRPESRAVSFPRVARLFDSPPSLLDVWLQPDALRIENVFIRLSSPAPFRGHAASAREVASSDHFPSGLRSLIEVLFPTKKCSPRRPVAESVYKLPPRR